jgi:gliding motility-associated-like protein
MKKALLLYSFFFLLVSLNVFAQGPQLNVVSSDVVCPSSGCQQIASSVQITNAAPNVTIDGASIFFYSGYTPAQDSLSFTPMFGITSTWNQNTGVLTLRGVATVTQYQQALQTVVLCNRTSNFVTGYRTIIYVLGDLLYNPVNGHYYKLIQSTTPISWTTAVANAAATNYLGLQGYLVTITNAQENSFISQLVNANTWIGASDAAASGIWRWVTGCEGLEDGGQGRHFSNGVNFGCTSSTGTGVSVGGNYQNWAVDEPNGCPGEDYAHLFFYGLWNDYSNTGSFVTNYIIEYGCMPGDPFVQAFDSIGLYVNDSIPKPNITNNLPVCSGGSVTLTANGTYTGNAVYSWSGPSSYSGNAQTTTITNATQSLNGNYIVTITDSACVTTRSFALNQGPPISSALVSKTDALCFGAASGSITQSGNNGVGPYTYQWNNGQTGATANNLIAGTYTVTVTDAIGCTGSSSYTIGEPTVLNAAITNSIDVSCQGNDGQATISATGGTGAYTYLWNSGSTNANGTGLTLGTFTVTVTDANGCTKVVNGSLSSIPSVTATSTGSNPTICIGQSATLSITAGGGKSPYTYLWSSGSTSASATVNPITTTTYTVTVTDANSCTAAYSYNVIVNPPITTTTSGTSTVCSGDPVTLGVNVSGGNGNHSYQWSNGATTSSTSVNPTVTTTYLVTATDNCGTPAKIDSVKITVIDYPTIKFSYTPDKGCMPLEVVFSDSSSTAAGSIYNWAFGNGDISNAINPSTIYPDSGLYTVILSITTPQGCTGSDTVVNAIEAYSTPVAEFSFAPLTPSILFNSVDFIDKSLGVVNQWNWVFGDSLGLATTNAPSFTFNEVGNYDVTLIVNNQYQCSDTIVKTISVLNDYSFFIPKAFSPNDDGVNDIFEMYGFNFSSFDIKIYTREGQLVNQAESNPLWNGLDLNGDPSPSGLYVYTINLRETLNQKRHEYRGTITLIR